MGMIERKKTILLNEPHLEKASGSVATFDTDMRSKLKECKIKFLPVQSGSDDPSPSNIRLITGLTGLTGHVTGKNLLNPNGNWSVNSTYRYIKFTETDQVCNMSFTLKDSTVNISNIYIGFIYTEALNSQSLNSGYRWVMEQGRIKDIKNNFASYPPSAVEKICKYCFIYPSSQSVLDRLFQAYDIQIEVGETASEYEPYTDTTIPVSWESEAGLLYGGYVDLTTGELAKEWESISLDQLNYSLNTVLSGVDRFYTTIANVVPPAGTRDLPNVISDRFKAEAINDANNKHSVWSVCGNGSTYYFYTPSGEYSSASEFRNAMKDVQFLCKRRTPIATYRLAPQQIKTFIGRNNIWSDAGNVEVKYWTH